MTSSNNPLRTRRSRFAFSVKFMPKHARAITLALQVDQLRGRESKEPTGIARQWEMSRILTRLAKDAGKPAPDPKNHIVTVGGFQHRIHEIIACAATVSLALRISEGVCEAIYRTGEAPEFRASLSSVCDALSLR
jgi:hypothetical protein